MAWADGVWSGNSISAAVTQHHGNSNSTSRRGAHAGAPHHLCRSDELAGRLSCSPDLGDCVHRVVLHLCDDKSSLPIGNVILTPLPEANRIPRLVHPDLIV